jgi:hypothetical protein
MEITGSHIYQYDRHIIDIDMYVKNKTKMNDTFYTEKDNSYYLKIM